MGVFEITAKQNLLSGKIQKGQTFQIVSGYTRRCDAAIADGLAKILGKWARQAQSKCFWKSSY